MRSFGPQDALAEIEKVLALPEAERLVVLVFLVTMEAKFLAPVPVEKF